MRMSRIIILSFMLCLLIGITLISLCIGENGIDISYLRSIADSSYDETQHLIITQLRLPRTLLALSVGGLLGFSGIVLQTLFRNPLVEPYTLGISGGSLLGVALCISLELTQVFGVFSTMLFAIIGAITTVFIVLSTISRHKSDTYSMLLTGIMISISSGAFTTLLISISTREQMTCIISWSIGSLESTMPWQSIAGCIITTLLFIVSHLFGNNMNGLLLGRNTAHSLGINIRVAIPFLFVISSIATAFCVSIVGMIAFIGMIVPHIIRTTIGSDQRIALPAGIMTGALVLLSCDIIARHIIYPRELPVGVVTGIIGGVIFIWINHKQRHSA